MFKYCWRLLYLSERVTYIRKNYFDTIFEKKNLINYFYSLCFPLLHFAALVFQLVQFTIMKIYVGSLVNS